MFKFSVFVRAQKDLEHSCCVMCLGKLPLIKKKKKQTQRLPVVRQQKFSFVGNPEVLLWGCFLEATSPWHPGALVQTVKFSYKSMSTRKPLESPLRKTRYKVPTTSK